MSMPKLPLPLVAVDAALEHAERHALPPTVITALLRQADVLRPIAEATLTVARRVAFRDPPPVPRFMA